VTIQRFVCKFVRWNPPGRIVSRKAEFGVLGNNQYAVGRPLGKFVTETYSIVVNPHNKIDLTLQSVSFLQVKNNLIVMVSDLGIGSPNGAPIFIGRTYFTAFANKVFAQIGLVVQLKRKCRWFNHFIVVEKKCPRRHTANK
jgi:phage FluMu protein Com